MTMKRKRIKSVRGPGVQRDVYFAKAQPCCASAHGWSELHMKKQPTKTGKCRACGKTYQLSKGVPEGIPDYCSVECFKKAEHVVDVQENQKPPVYYRLCSVNEDGQECEVARMVTSAPIPETRRPLSGVDAARYLFKDLGADQMIQMRLEAILQGGGASPEVTRHTKALAALLLGHALGVDTDKVVTTHQQKDRKHLSEACGGRPLHSKGYRGKQSGYGKK